MPGVLSAGEESAREPTSVIHFLGCEGVPRHLASGPGMIRQRKMASRAEGADRVGISLPCRSKAH